MTRARTAIVLLFLVQTGCLNSLVGAECADGLSECSGTCLDLNDNDLHCGRCDNMCPSGNYCSTSACVAGDRPDASAQDASSRDASLIDASSTDASSTDASSIDAGCAFNQTWCSSGCVDILSDPLHCGGCESPCLFTCCTGTCVDTDMDPDNCGMCDESCPGGICAAGSCPGAFVGHLVVIGHDYVSPRVGMNRLVGNAVFVVPGSPVNTVVFEGSALPASIIGTDIAIDQVATERGRAWQRTVANAAQVPNMLPGAGVLVIYAQEGSDDATLNMLGTQWSAALLTFLSSGGVVILLEGGGSHQGTYQVLQAAGLFVANSRTVVTGQQLTVVTPGSVIAVGVPSVYLAETTSVYFDTAETTVVVEHFPTGSPVVIDRIF